METRICKNCKEEKVFLQVGDNIWECNGCGELYGNNFWKDKKDNTLSESNEVEHE